MAITDKHSFNYHLKIYLFYIYSLSDSPVLSTTTDISANRRNPLYTDYVTKKKTFDKVENFFV